MFEELWMKGALDLSAPLAAEISTYSIFCYASHDTPLVQLSEYMEKDVRKQD